MRAKVMKIGEKTVVLKGENGKFTTVSKKELDFNYRLGSVITVEKNGSELYFLPLDSDFWGGSGEDDDSGKTTNALIFSLINLGGALVGIFIAWKICLCVSFVFCIAAIFSLADPRGSKDSNRGVATTVLFAGIILWIVVLYLAAVTGSY